MTNIELFSLFVEHHNPKLFMLVDGMTYCTDSSMNCLGCVIFNECVSNHLGRLPSLTAKELEEVKITHPEFFI